MKKLKNINFTDFSAAILAGGNNSRFNHVHKAFLIYQKKQFIDIIVGILYPKFSEILIITNHKELFKNYFNVKFFEDKFKGIGPISGIHSALINSKNNNVFIVSCDMPFID